MSASLSLSTLPLSDAERVDVRRFLDYPAFGSGASGEQSWRFFQAYGSLEYRMSNLASGELQVVRQFLASLYALEQAVPAAGDNLDTSQAAVWTHNPREVADRAGLLAMWSLRLAKFLGVPYGPASAGPGAITI